MRSSQATFLAYFHFSNYPIAEISAIQNLFNFQCLYSFFKQTIWETYMSQFTKTYPSFLPYVKSLLLSLP